MGKIQSIIDKLTNNTEGLENIKHKGLIVYTLFQYTYAVSLFIYGCIQKEYFEFLGQTAVFMLVMNSTIIYFSRKDFLWTSRISIFLFFFLESFYVLGYQYDDAINSIAIVQYVIISFIALVILNWRWSLSVIVLGIGMISLDYFIYKMGDWGMVLPVHNTRDALVINTMNLILVFLFFMLYYQLFVKYYILYQRESNRSQVLNDDLIIKNIHLEELNQQLEAYISSLEESNEKFERYSWMNSHHLRAPIARIQGLIHVKRFSSDPEEIAFIDTQIEKTTQELDSVVRELNVLLTLIKEK